MASDVPPTPPTAGHGKKAFDAFAGVTKIGVHQNQRQQYLHMVQVQDYSECWQPAPAGEIQDPFEEQPQNLAQ